MDLPILQYNLNKILLINIVDNLKKIETKYNLPTENDLEGVTLAILRIQEVYNILAEEIANGDINKMSFGKKFTAADCLAVANKLTALEYHYYSIGWYEMVLKRIEEEGWKGITPEIDENIILDHLAYAQYSEESIENIKASIETSIKALNKDFSHPNSIHITANLKVYIEHYIALKSGIKQTTAMDPPKGALSRNNITELELLKRGCRGELKKSPAEQRKLFCKYETENNPFLKLAPIKVEVMNLQPYLVLFHDVLYDSEIEILKKISMDKLKRSSIWNEFKSRNEPSNVRTSKLVWLDNTTHSLIHVLNQRVMDMTGLTMETAEDFQLMNYGIGGHYDIHSDYFIEPNDNNNLQPYGFYELGNRIGTVLFYMSEVLYGGGTVWPSINILTLPKKGSAAFWHNLFADGEANFDSRHSACPIIAGSKWVMNKWIRLRGQEFKRPCYTYSDSIG